jgi:hypothetical protein
MQSIFHDQFEIAEMLLEKKVDVCTMDHEGNSILHHLCSKDQDNAKFVKLLVEAPHGISIINARDSDGATPILHAATHGLIKTVQFLASLENCDINAALLEIASNGSRDMLHTLLMAGADFTATNRKHEDMFSIISKRFLSPGRTSKNSFATLPVFVALQKRTELNVYCDETLLQNPSLLEKLVAVYTKRSEHRDKLVQEIKDLETRQGRSYNPPDMCLSAAAIATLEDSTRASRTTLEQLEDIVLEAARHIYAIWTATSDWEKKIDDVINSPGYQSDPVDNVSLAISKGSTGAAALLAVPLDVTADDIRRKSKLRVAYWQVAMTVLYECSVCMETCIRVQAAQAVFENMTMPCSHLSKVCKDCFGRYSRCCLQDSERVTSSGLPCVNHDCSEVIPLNILHSIYSSYEMAKLKMLMLNAALNEDSTSVWCFNYANCNGIARKNAEGVGICDRCDTLTCCLSKACGHAHHPGQLCEDVRDKSMDELKKEQSWQNCPKCGALVEKISGCDHMDCIFCKCKFCYFCGKTPRCGQRCSKRDK